jgi:hypothetical protein
MQSVDEAGHEPAAALRTFSRQGDTIGDDDQAVQAGSLRTLTVGQAERLKDLGQHGSRKRSSSDIRREPTFVSQSSREKPHFSLTEPQFRHEGNLGA